MLTATAGFRHDSIGTARQALTNLGATSGAFTITATEDLSAVSASSLAGYDVLFFALTTGELTFTAEQKAAMLAFVSQGGGFMGAHSATDTLYTWPEYDALVGAHFREHPWTQTATVIVEDRMHPATSMLAAQFSIQEEFYAFRENPRPRVRVLLRLDTRLSVRLATSRSPGHTRTETGACTTTPSGTFPEPGPIRCFSSRSPRRFNGRGAGESRLQHVTERAEGSGSR